MSGYQGGLEHRDPTPYTAPPSLTPTYIIPPAEPMQKSSSANHISPRPGTVILPPTSSDRPRQTFSTFSIREPGQPGFDARPSSSGSAPPESRLSYDGPSFSGSKYPSRASPESRSRSNGYDGHSSRVHDRNGPANQWEGPDFAGRAGYTDSGSVPPPNPDYDPHRAEYNRANSAGAVQHPQAGVGGGLGLGGPIGGADPRFTRNGEPIKVDPRPNSSHARRTPHGSPEKVITELADRSTQAYPHPHASRTDQLREVPTGPSGGRPRTPAAPHLADADIPAAPRSGPSAPSQPSQPSMPSQLQFSGTASIAQPAATSGSINVTAANHAEPATDAGIQDDDMTELSSLAKLRQFKASIATKRSKQLHDVDSDALAEMAASFLASANAVPPTPATIEASQLGLTALPVSTQPLAESTSAPSTSTTLDAAAASKAREQELKEKLKAKALKNETGSSTPGPAAASSPTTSSSRLGDRQPTTDAPSKAPVKRDRLEEGEIAEEVKRAKIELMPASASTTDSRAPDDNTASADSNDPSRSAGKRKRAQEWMKTTAGSAEGSAGSGDKSAKTPFQEGMDQLKAAYVDAFPSTGESRSLSSRVARDSGRKDRQTSPGDRGRSTKIETKPRGKSRSPVKDSQRTSAAGNKEWQKPKPGAEDQVKVKVESDRETKPSLAERIGLSVNKDPAPHKYSDILDTPLGSRDRRDSVGRSGRPSGSAYEHNNPLDQRRRSRSPQRSANNARPFESDRNGRDRPSITSRDPDYRERVRGRDMSPYAASRQRSPARDSFRISYGNNERDDRDRNRNDRRDDRSDYPRIEPHGLSARLAKRHEPSPQVATKSALAASAPPASAPAPAPAPALAPAPVPASNPASAAPSQSDGVAETLALLKAQIARLESQIPSAAPATTVPAAAPAPAPVSAPAPIPVPAPQARYPPPLPAQTRQAPPAPSYAPDNRGYVQDTRYDRERERDRDRRADYDRPPQPSGPPLSAYERQRPLTPTPIPLHAHSRNGPPPSRYQDSHSHVPPPQQQQSRYHDPREFPQDYPRDTRDDRSYRGPPPPRGYDPLPPIGGPPPARNGYDQPPRDYLDGPSGGGGPAGYGGGGYRQGGPPMRDLSPPPSSRPYNNYDPHRSARLDDAPPFPRTEYRERYDPASRPGPPPPRFATGGGASPAPSSYGGGAYESRAGPPIDEYSRYPSGPPHPPRRSGGFDNRAANAGSARGGAISGRGGRGGYEDGLGGDRERDRDMRDRDYERDRERERDMRDRERDYEDFGGRGGYRGGRGGGSGRGRGH